MKVLILLVILNICFSTTYYDNFHSSIGYSLNNKILLGYDRNDVGFKVASNLSDSHFIYGTYQYGFGINVGYLNGGVALGLHYLMSLPVRDKYSVFCMYEYNQSLSTSEKKENNVYFGIKFNYYTAVSYTNADVTIGNINKTDFYNNLFKDFLMLNDYKIQDYNETTGLYKIYVGTREEQSKANTQMNYNQYLKTSTAQTTYTPGKTYNLFYFFRISENNNEIKITISNDISSQSYTLGNTFNKFISYLKSNGYNYNIVYN